MRLRKRIDREPLPSVKNLQLVHGNPTLNARNGENAAIVEDRFEMKGLACSVLAVSSICVGSKQLTCGESLMGCWSHQ